MYNKDKTTISQNSSTKHSAFNIYQLFPQRTEDECLAELKQYPKLYWTYKNWPDDWKKRFMEFMEGKKGRIKPGQLADIVVLDKDIFTCDPMEIRDILPVMTMIDGKIVYKK